MSYISSLNKKLHKHFGTTISASEQNGCLHLTGELSDWQEIVKAGLLSVNKKRYLGVVNDVKLVGVTIPPMKLPPFSDSTLEGAQPDVLVIGGGIIGCSIARELKRYQIDVLLVEKEHDVATHASGRNDGMVHPGIDLRKGQLKKKYNDLGNRMYESVCEDLGVPFRRTGQYLCFTKASMKPVALASSLYWKMMKIPYRYISREELKKQEPHLSGQIACALFFPTAGTVCPYGLTIAYAENATDNGARLCLDTAVIDMGVRDGVIQSVLTNRGRVYPKLVINAAGVFSEEIARMAKDRFFSIHPRRGTNMILDKKAAFQVKTIASSLGSVDKKAGHSKGGGIVRTVDDNLLVGPDAVETYERENFETHRESVEKNLVKQRLTSPSLREGDIITYFTGVRAASYEEDFIITPGKFTKNILHAAGIQSPGITAAPAIAKEIAKMAAQQLSAAMSDAFDPVRVPIPRTTDMTAEERDALIKEDADYGQIVCRCEEVSRGEIRDALHRSVPCDSVDGVKRRVRAGMGRCQGGFCSPQIARIIAEELHIPLAQVRKNTYDSRILLGGNKEDSWSKNFMMSL
jgi:glycerol-3-phosphate dehydrogenase